MRLLITGVCGFVGSSIARRLIDTNPGIAVVGIDNFSRAGSVTNAAPLKAIGVDVRHGDVRCVSDLETIGECDWVIDAAALPSVLAGVDGRSSSQQLVEHNLFGTIHLLEFARRHAAGFVLLSTSRVYGVDALTRIPVTTRGDAFAFDAAGEAIAGVSEAGIDESFSTAAPVSLYGGTKLASETMALEYAHAFGLRVLINRCGVMAGGGQFGTADQGIFSYWLRAYATRRPLRYIGFDGTGRQVRDALHPDDLTDLLLLQMRSETRHGVWNVGGGVGNMRSLAEVSAWCAERFGRHTVDPDLRPRPYDTPWIVMNAGLVSQQFNWQPKRTIESVFDEIAIHHERRPDWLALSGNA